jgi:hypothetical protein
VSNEVDEATEKLYELCGQAVDCVHDRRQLPENWANLLRTAWNDLIDAIRHELNIEKLSDETADLFSSLTPSKIVVLAERARLAATHPSNAPT